MYLKKSPVFCFYEDVISYPENILRDPDDFTLRQLGRLPCGEGWIGVERTSKPAAGNNVVLEFWHLRDSSTLNKEGKIKKLLVSAMGMFQLDC